MTTWLLDGTFRPQGEPEIDVEPDGTIEVAWERTDENGDKAALTLLLAPDIFHRVVERGKELELLGKVAYTDAG